MPKLPIEYSKTIIYKLCCLDQSINDIYIGHTTDFTKRKCSHKLNCNNENNKDYNCYVYQFIRKHGGWDNWNMIQIEEYPCNNKREAEARETYWMKELKSTLNSYISFRTEEEKKQYQKTDTYKEWKKEYMKKYQKMDKQKEYMKEYQKMDKQKEYKKQWQQKKCLYLNELKCFNIV
jgi:hypothetical protein